MFTDQITVFILRLKEENNIIKHVIIFSKQILNKSTAAGDQSTTVIHVQTFNFIIKYDHVMFGTVRAIVMSAFKPGDVCCNKIPNV